MPQVPDGFSVVGGASFPLEDGGWTYTWPLARLTVSAQGIRVTARRVLLAPPMSCTFTWAELRSVDVRWGRIALHGPNYRDVTFGNMFAPAKLKVIVEQARRRGIPITNT